MKYKEKQPGQVASNFHMGFSLVQRLEAVTTTGKPEEDPDLHARALKEEQARQRAASRAPIRYTGGGPSSSTGREIARKDYNGPGDHDNGSGSQK